MERWFDQALGVVTILHQIIEYFSSLDCTAPCCWLIELMLEMCNNMFVDSCRSLHNIFHSGYCSAYIQNYKYLLLLDFRSVEDWIVERVITSQHYNQFSILDKSISQIIFSL